MTRYVFIYAGGVVSSLGKGLASAALGALLRPARSFKVRLRKRDPYLSVDPGTMSPYQHGEVFVTDDEAETDSTSAIERASPACRRRRPTTSRRAASISTSSPRNGQGDYLGATIQVIPHVTQRHQGVRDRRQRGLRLRAERDRRHGGRHREPALLRGDPGSSATISPRGRAIYVHLTLLPYIPSTAG